MSFHMFKMAVAAQFERMRGYELFRTTADKDELWNLYLNSFPDGSNPIFRKRTEHDCSCCRQFIRAIGNVVAVINGKVVSIWDCDVAPGKNAAAYQKVANALSFLVRSSPIDNLFLTTERVAGTDRTFEQATGETVLTWQHFFVNIPKKFVCDGPSIGPKLSESQAQHDVFLRSLNEISIDAVETVLELVAQGSLYRGEEHKRVLTTFLELKKQFSQISFVNQRDNYVWTAISNLSVAVSKIRNTSIGTLLVDLSIGMELENAVRKFEAMVAPTNYRRPTALVTPRMIADAKAKLTELGLISALERRYAKMTDVPIQAVLFADRSLKRVGGDVFDELSANAKPKMGKIEEVGITSFIEDILPRVTKMEALVETRHTGNFVSLVSPVDPTAERLFKWRNGMSWTYNGDVADSIRERVKAAGGNVTGDLCCRLSWSNYDDLDLHMVEPNGREIFYGCKLSISTWGRLDVDMNAGMGSSRQPVENIFYEKTSQMKEGKYQLYVHQYFQRENTDIGFEVEIDFKGTVWRFSHDKKMANRSKCIVAEFTYSHKNGIEGLPAQDSWRPSSKEVWGISTETLTPVSLVALSPNYWALDNAVGPLHYFFFLDGCVNDGTARGFYNEFLKGELDAHRKVMEMVGSKVRTEASENQLSGLGFSSTRRDSLTVRVTGAFTRTLKINF